MVVKHGDESHGTICKKSPTKQIQVELKLWRILYISQVLVGLCLRKPLGFGKHYNWMVLEQNYNNNLEAPAFHQLTVVGNQIFYHDPSTDRVKKALDEGLACKA